MKKVVFLTGATGTMGFETLKKLLENQDELQTRVLARDSKKNREMLAPYLDRIEVLWGDLKDDDLLKQGVTGADYVLHIGALVSPMADAYPEETLRINYGSTLCMLKAIKELGQKDATHFVYIGTIAETGDRMPPIHWGRVGDPLKPSIYDYYALSKLYSERAVIESGLKYWVSIRQTGMMPSNEAAAGLPILSHHPANNVLEWSNAEDSGNLMRNICTMAPDRFWRKVYNLSGGVDYRQTNFTQYINQGMDERLLMEPNWMALHNFHGHYYLDADELEAVVPFRTKSYKEFMGEMNAKSYQKMQMAMQADPNFKPPTLDEMRAGFKAAISKPGGVLQFVADNDEERIKVWFGSREKYEAIPKTWDEFILYKPLDLPGKPLDRGFDETKPVEELDIADMQQAAKFRGGECLSETMVKGYLYTPLKWRCAQGHEFEACPYTVLFTGHWCQECLCGEWRFGEMAEESPFFAQVWEPLHKGEEPFRVKMVIDATDIEKLYN